MLNVDAQQCDADGALAQIVATLPKDTRLGAYRIDRVIGEGGMGFVYEATHEVLNRRSAIKMLRPELASQPHVVTRFLNEAKAVNLIDHQNIVNVYDYGDNRDGNVWFVMEFLEGQTLDDLMRKRRPMQTPLLLHVFGQIARALAAAHGKQIVHRDLKPGNVFVVAREDNPYFIKLLDFGIAQLRGGGAQAMTIAGSVMGTPQYMSPEQITGGVVDARSDVWALGVMLYRAATGEAPYRGEEFGELADRILHHPPPPAGTLVALPASLSALIASCLERRIEDRCPSVGAVLQGLARVKHECGLDDDAILAAVAADAGTFGEALPPQRDPTRGSLAGSRPRYQGADSLEGGPQPGVVPRPRSRLGLYMAIAAVVGAATAAVLVLRGAPDRPTGPGPTRVAEPPPTPAPAKTIKSEHASGYAAGVRALARRDLEDAIASGTLQRQGFAVDALAMARVPAGAPLLYRALEATPAVRVKAAHAIGALGLPDAAPKLRAALAASGDALRFELAAVLFSLGDKDARAILVRGLDDPKTRLTAAAALAEAGDDAGRAVLDDVVATTPPGREQWRRAAGGLVRLGDAAARTLLAGELSQSDPARAIGAAEILARAGDRAAQDQLARVATDPQAAQAGEAALALARLGDQRALDWVAAGLASSDAGNRTHALGICGVLAAGATAHTGRIAAIATDDPDVSVRMTAEAVLLGL